MGSTVLSHLSKLNQAAKTIMFGKYHNDYPSFPLCHKSRWPSIIQGPFFRHQGQLRGRVACEVNLSSSKPLPTPVTQVHQCHQFPLLLGGQYLVWHRDRPAVTDCPGTTLPGLVFLGCFSIREPRRNGFSTWAVQASCWGGRRGYPGAAFWASSSDAWDNLWSRADVICFRQPVRRLAYLGFCCTYKKIWLGRRRQVF